MADRTYTVPPTTSADMIDDDALGESDTESDADTCEVVVESTGEVCGRELPCQYHD